MFVTLCSSIYNELRLEDTLCDTVIRAGGGLDFKVHRLILCGCSSYFRVLFCIKPASQQQVYSFPGVSPNGMQLILDYAYTGSVTVTEDNVMELFEGAELFGIQDIVQSCYSLLLQKLCSRNCISIWKLAEQYNYTELRDKAFLYMLYHFEDIAGYSAEFLLLSGEQLADIIGRDELHVKQESAVFQAVLRWVNFAPEKHRDHMTILMSKVRLLLMPLDYLLDTETKVEQVKNNRQCLNMVIHTIKVRRESNTNRSQLRTRLPSHVLPAFGGIDNNHTTDKTELYDVRSDYWRTVFRSDKALPESSSCVYLNGSIYYIGGCENNSYLSSVQRFCLATKTWQEVGSMHKGRCSFSVVVTDSESVSHLQMFHIGSQVYVCGGRLSDGFLSSVECYNPNNNQWMLITPMTSPRAAVGVISNKDHLYVIGGYNSITYVSTVEVYDPLLKSWETASSMIHPRCNFGIAVLEDQLFVVGGVHKNGTSSVELYDGTIDSWQPVQDLEAPRFAVGCCVVERQPDTPEPQESHLHLVLTSN
uniref:Kelch like family member 10 n=1 Tax=Nothobranchius furzeri TaxID=105023 RepID=A0A8C6NUI4_NOTFU